MGEINEFSLEVKAFFEDLPSLYENHPSLKIGEGWLILTHRIERAAN